MTDHELQLKAVALRCDSKPIEFDGFGNCGEFAIIKRQAGKLGWILIPSNSRELEVATQVASHD